MNRALRTPSGFELITAEAVFEALYGPLVSTEHRGPVLRDWLSTTLRAATLEAALGVRIALVFVGLAPWWVLRRLQSFAALEASAAQQVLLRLSKLDLYALRQLLVMLKALFGLFAGLDDRFVAVTHGRVPRVHLPQTQPDGSKP